MQWRVDPAVPTVPAARVIPVAGKEKPQPERGLAGASFGGLVRESVIHEILARAFRPNVLWESTALHGCVGAGVTGGAPASNE